MKSRLDYVPATFGQAVEEVLRGLDRHEREQLISLNSAPLHGLNPSLGLTILRAWSVWGRGTPLGIDFRLRGLPERPDDLAIEILEESWGECCDRIGRGKPY